MTTIIPVATTRIFDPLAGMATPIGRASVRSVMRTKWRNAAKVATGAVACRAGPPPLFRRFGRGRPMRLGIVALAIGEQVAREEAAETLFDAVGEAEARRDDQQRQQRRQDQPEIGRAHV